MYPTVPLLFPPPRQLSFSKTEGQTIEIDLPGPFTAGRFRGFSWNSQRPDSGDGIRQHRGCP